ncbi:MAG TPA: DUF5047 domain-containing protein [Micromonospora sp.]|nr:DUF5047 domain-containing protein [Micromonospora sp.]
MRPVSERFLETLRGSHQAIFRAKVVTTWQTGTEPTGVDIPIEAGDVQMDATADIRSTVDLTTLGTWPTKANSLLAPYGNELFVSRGIDYGNGQREWVSLGYYRLYTPGQDEVPDGGQDGKIRLAAKDRMSAILDARLLAPIQVPATRSFGSVVDELVREVYPAATIEWDDAAVRNRQVGRSLIAEEERHGFLDELITSLGKVWYWDHRGILVIRDAPDSERPVWEVNAGVDGVLLSVSRELSREGVYNAVVAYGEAADEADPPRAVATDDNSDSPTYWHGRFGKVPRYYSSPFITTDEQAKSAAESMLRQQLGLPYSVDFTAIPNPALEPGDPVRVVYPDGASEVHVIESLTIPLTVDGALSASTREQTRILIGVT